MADKVEPRRGDPEALAEWLRQQSEEEERMIRCSRALSGISDPEQFMADVRELIRLDKDHDIDGGGCYGCRVTIARIAAQLKGV